MQCNLKDLYNYYEKENDGINLNTIIESYKDPYIYLYIYNGKPWENVQRKNNKVCVDNFTRFYEIARKTDIYFEFLEKYEILY